jgi:mannose-1-phosphate guanylyltransferase
MASQSWAIVLAGGEGTRIQPLIKRCLGFACPKQYFTFCGERSMLEHTIDRAVELVGPERLITVIGSGHRRYLETQRVQGLVIEQPISRGTGAGIFLPLTHIFARDPDATILIFPSDHFVCPRTEFLEQVDHARDCAENFDEKIILMGAVPDLPETDYGWVEPGKQLSGSNWHSPLPVHEVASFCEKPGAEEAKTCFAQGYLWNTMIIAAKIKALWKLGKRLLPEVTGKFESFQRILLGSRVKRRREEEGSLVRLYETIPAFDFSSSFLTQSANQLAVMPLQNVLWSDWGRPERVFDSLRKIGRKPRFLESVRRWRRH